MPTGAEEVKAQYDASGKEAKPENEIYGVGGTAKDGDVSTAATVADGGPEGEEKDETYKP